jgi:AraC-like DNA-binding protein
MLRLQHTDGVVIISEFYEMRVSVNLFHDYPQEQIAQAIASSCNGRVVTSWQTEFPGVSRKLTKLDWEIIEGLMKNPERKLSDLADRLGVSTRTVKRRVKDMMGSYAFFLLPVINLKKIKGVPCQLIVESDVSKKHALDKLITSNFDPIMRFRNTESRTHSVYGFACANVTDGAEIRKSIENQPGVRTVRMNIVEQLVHVYDWIESEVSLMVSRSNA